MLNFLLTSLWIGGVSFGAWHFSEHSVLITFVAGLIATLIRFLPRVGLDVLSEF